MRLSDDSLPILHYAHILQREVLWHLLSFRPLKTLPLRHLRQWADMLPAVIKWTGEASLRAWHHWYGKLDSCPVTLYCSHHTFLVLDSAMNFPFLLQSRIADRGWTWTRMVCLEVYPFMNCHQRLESSRKVCASWPTMNFSSGKWTAQNL